MGMRGMLEQISEGQLKDFISNPRLAYRYISDPHAGVGKRKASKLELVKASNEPRKQLSLEKDWHFLHYMLNGTVEGGTAPLSQVVLGGTEIANPDGLRDYDTLRYLKPDQVNEVAVALTQVDAKKLADAFDPEDAVKKRIYGMGSYGMAVRAQLPGSSLSFMLERLPPEKRKLLTDRLQAAAANPPRPSPEDVLEMIEPVRSFYQEAARDGNAVLLYLT
jgi:hypothetical protein